MTLEELRLAPPPKLYDKPRKTTRQFFALTGRDAIYTDDGDRVYFDSEPALCGHMGASIWDFDPMEMVRIEDYDQGDCFAYVRK